MTLDTNHPEILDREHWLAAQQKNLIKEKAFSRERDALAAARRQLPWTEVSPDYSFATSTGSVTLAELFEGRSQLIVYHFMFGPGWGEEGCPSCSFWADNYDGISSHLAARDTSFVAVSTASMSQIETYRNRMGWDFRWVSCAGSSFNHDLGASATPDQVEAGELNYNMATSPPMGTESPLVSVFFRDGDRTYLTFQLAARGLDWVNGTYHHLDLTPKGRDEADLPWTMAWLRRHDEYEE